MGVAVGVIGVAVGSGVGGMGVAVGSGVGEMGVAVGASPRGCLDAGSRVGVGIGVAVGTRVGATPPAGAPSGGRVRVGAAGTMGVPGVEAGRAVASAIVPPIASSSNAKATDNATRRNATDVSGVADVPPDAPGTAPSGSVRSDSASSGSVLSHAVHRAPA